MRRTAASTSARWRRRRSSTSRRSGTSEQRSTGKLPDILVFLALCAAALAVAALIYPGELSHLSPALNRWLYDRGAATYEKKWAAARFRDAATEGAIVDFARLALDRGGERRVLDLGCGTGRGARLLLPQLPDDIAYVGVDQSAGMLGQFRGWIEGQPDALSRRIALRHESLSDWAAESDGERFGLVLMLEVGEFLPDFADVIGRACARLAPGGGLVLTRPAGWWWLFFPGRHQSRRALAKFLASQSMTQIAFRPWRSRYELVFARHL